MSKFLLFGASLHGNFGGPSILYGAVELWKKYFDNLEIVYLDPKFNGSMPFPVKVIDINKYNFRELLFAALLYKTTKKISGSDKTQELLSHYLESDAVIDMMGIEFTDKLFFSKSLKMLFYPIISFIGVILGKKIIKNTASYGPMLLGFTKWNAKKYLSSWCDLVLCREKESKLELEKIRIKKMLSVIPDTGLAMPVDQSIAPRYLSTTRKTIGISVSHQMHRQLKKRGDQYLAALIEVCNQFSDEYSILLIPNEIDISDENDISFCEKIADRVNKKDSVKILDCSKMQAPQLKGIISNCHIMIASRYHSVVAALSSNVPTVVIGWHVKYMELLSLYGQEEFLLPEEKIDDQLFLLEKVQLLLRNKDKVKDALIEKNVEIIKKLDEGTEKIKEVINSVQIPRR
ncbi:MAG: polysaccharide pyruvyl transferase family protein [Candidatus Thermoplasmatota archaeon]|nr:polysaccharide pyruvyl transferase family protein [Candidatus Thermoplasmatota archaeon]